ncbi:hypothetical protein DYBT9623_03871 [Dyadobacter sp. CECT 9623]|jgi:hypothetical protein|uniref:Uncharacterized protein n=1 Tax=Dyadobacter linearis TaxID=2823330 RepID=A0ABM8UU64_9BACT|nr:MULTISPECIES: hypothetical protein [unclassified Dyadobacter]MCE7062716.1 hypothetical protein [Dyadobacter sp. CY343]CAG5071895.1 hypothetical protein DYBT9623_03871 [Dyadobacter sp. CECT 9623]
MALPDQLKKAIIQMPTKEKDRLLLRLITKDKTLADRLHFELIEDSLTIPERREDIAATITRTSKFNQNTPGWILMDLRNLSGDIAYHVKVTKDKIGGMELNLFMLNTFLENYSDILKTYSSRADTCALYIAKKAQVILNAFNKLDEDYRVDYLKDVNRMLKLVYSLCSKMYARQMELPQEIE